MRIGQITPKKKQFILFLTTGGIAALVNVVSRIGFSQIMRFELAVLPAYLLGMVTAYVLAKRFVFINSKQSIRRSFATFSVVNLAAILQTWIVSIAVRGLILPILKVEVLVELIAHSCGVVVPVFTSFFGHKYLSFRDVN